MSQLNNVTLVGDQTGGGGDVPNNYILSNGWKLQYTATLTLNAALQPVENGIEPNVKVAITPINETKGEEPILERAYELLK